MALSSQPLACRDVKYASLVSDWREEDVRRGRDLGFTRSPRCAAPTAITRTPRARVVRSMAETQVRKGKFRPRRGPLSLGEARCLMGDVEGTLGSVPSRACGWMGEDQWVTGLMPVKARLYMS